jgi:hypothetical protein
VARQPLAVDFFLIAHDPFDDGRLRIGPELLGCGLVGAELADLVLARRLGFDGEDLVVLDPGGQLDEVDDYVIEAVGSQESVHPVRTWVEPLQDGLYALVGRKLVASGTVRRTQGTRRIARGRQPDRFPANDLLAASRPQQDLEAFLRAPRNLTLPAGMLAALIGVLGIDGLLTPDLDRTFLRELLAEIEQNLPTDLRAVCDGVRTVTAEMSLRAR